MINWISYALTVLNNEDGDFSLPGGTLGTVLLVLLIVCAIIFIVINVDFDIQGD